ncbi:hypothetical protein R5R35_004129 [Gryllus longicercus]|uniref:FYVE-type domain-containing protein n=1 Tax=Gryllus longicercus TaxID=2509291 RepID=A0AAN9VGR9_9ORTH
MAECGEILEGFLCPICKADLGSEHQLRIHFQDEAHKEHQDVFKSLKDVFEKAKKKILKIDDEVYVPEFSSNVVPISEPHSSTLFRFEPQEIGEFRCHTAYFRELRNKRLERYTAETNKLLIRLGKLMLDLPVDPLKRKTHEQAIVPWIDDRDVKLCPSCARSFNMMRRKHHCRLCGAIMCHDCTRFLELSEAKKMINMSFGSDGEPNEGASTSIVKNFPPFRPLGRSSSNNSLNSVLSLVDAKTGEQHLRLCIHCKELLETREKLKETRNLKPIISQFYERLQLYITEVDQLCTLYCKMCQSLNCGEKTHTVVEAQELRGKILTLAGSIDNLSKKIAILGTKDVENPPKGRTLQLQQNIKIATNYYLKDRVIGLPSVPTELAFKSLQESRR